MIELKNIVFLKLNMCCFLLFSKCRYKWNLRIFILSFCGGYFMLFSLLIVIVFLVRKFHLNIFLFSCAFLKNFQNKIKKN